MLASIAGRAGIVLAGRGTALRALFHGKCCCGYCEEAAFLGRQRERSQGPAFVSSDARRGLERGAKDAVGGTAAGMESSVRVAGSAGGFYSGRLAMRWFGESFSGVWHLEVEGGWSVDCFALRGRMARVG